MKLSKTFHLSLAATALASALTIAPTASAEVDLSASVGVANMYLWRGFDVGQGDAAVFGDITASSAGFYASVWASSGDSFAGQEYDLIVGYGAEFGDFFFDIAAVSYVYPSEPSPFEDMTDTEIGDWIEAILTVGYGPLSLSWYETIEAKEGTYAIGEDYRYYTLGFELGSFSFLLGHHDYNERGLDNDTHLDISYHYNERLSFTVSKLVESGDDVDDDALFVVSYTLPLN